LRCDAQYVTTLCSCFEHPDTISTNSDVVNANTTHNNISVRSRLAVVESEVRIDY
jgi:hypothetical protein